MWNPETKKIFKSRDVIIKKFGESRKPEEECFNFEVHLGEKNKVDVVQKIAAIEYNHVENKLENFEEKSDAEDQDDEDPVAGPAEENREVMK